MIIASYYSTLHYCNFFGRDSFVCCDLLQQDENPELHGVSVMVLWIWSIRGNQKTARVSVSVCLFVQEFFFFPCATTSKSDSYRLNYLPVGVPIGPSAGQGNLSKVH